MKRNALPLEIDRKGYLYVSLAAVLFAVSGTCAKFLFNEGISAQQLIQLRTSLACAGLMIWLGLAYSKRLKISWSDLPYFVCLGVFGIGAAQYFYLFAISKINVAAAILLHYTGPVFVALYALIVQGKKIGIQGLLAIIGTLGGSFLVVGAYNFQLLAMNRMGIIGGLLAAVSFAIYSILSAQGMQKYSPWTVLFYGMLFAAVIWHILYPPMEAFRSSYSTVQWGWILFIGVGGTIVPFWLYFEGINRIQPTHASITATIEPIAAGITAAVFLGEQMEPLQITGGLVVIVSIVILQLNRKTQNLKSLE